VDAGQIITGQHRGGAPFLLTGLTAGATTFKAKYLRLTGGTVTFSTRNIAVIPL
jgi:hypothetical protein